MCGRYVLYTTDKLQSRYQAKIVGDFLAPSYNITPGTQSPAIIHFSSTKVIYPMKWGLIPSWSRDGSIGNRLINARSETILSKPAFKSSIYSKRCLIPANGYFEWGIYNHQKQPFYFHPSQDQIISLAGIYDIWDSPDGSPIFSYTIITAPAQPKFSPVHDRMPLIIPKIAENQWLDPKISPNLLQHLLVPPPVNLDFHPVSLQLNSPSADHPDLIAPL